MNRIGFTIVLMILAYTLSYAQHLEIRQSAELSYSYELTKTAFCSDGSDRAQNDNPRFAGPMEAVGITYKNYQYISYYDADGSVVIARRNVLNSDSWEKTSVPDYYMKLGDRHRKIALCISKGDGVIHVAFDHHNTPILNYARTAIGVADNPETVDWNSTVFSYVPNLNIKEETGKVTYPSFIPLKGTGDMLIYWRTGGAIGGEMNLAHYSSLSHSWTFIGQFTSRNGYYNGKYGERGPYHTGFNSDANGNIHIAWLWREEFDLRDNSEIKYGNHGLYYANSNDGGFSWFDTKGKLIADTKKGEQVSIDNIGGTVVDIPMTTEPSNGLTFSALDNRTGKLYVIASHFIENTKTKKSFLYIRDVNGDWSKSILKQSLGGGALHFTDDFLFSVSNTDIYVAKREEDFKNWTKISVNESFPKGESNWDFGRISEGVLSLIIQHNPKTIGSPSPVEVFDLKIADSIEK